MKNLLKPEIESFMQFIHLSHKQMGFHPIKTRFGVIISLFHPLKLLHGISALTFTLSCNQ